MNSEKILILDFGSQYTLLIAKKLRSLGIHSEIHPGFDGNLKSPDDYRGIILSGGPETVNAEHLAKTPSWVWQGSRPVLGICFGMQAIVAHFGGVNRTGESREFGRTQLQLTDSNTIKSFNLEANQNFSVWMSHGDDVVTPPDGFEVLGRTHNQVIAFIGDSKRQFFGVQFHPEVYHSEKGEEILSGFCTNICNITSKWSAKEAKDVILSDLKKRSIAPEEKILVAVSGGVDSTVTACLLTEIYGRDRVLCAYVDHGFMRKHETEWILQNYEQLKLNIHCIDARVKFFNGLKGLSDPELKRKAIGRMFVESLEDYAKQHSDLQYLGQGTLYPDVIESASHGHGSHVIKSHHNVGGLPERLALELIEPLNRLFKDEVRKIGTLMGIPHELLHRHPFPGPGLAIRIPGEISEEKVSILREADHLFMSGLRENDFYKSVWQAGVILLPVKSVGVMGDQRTYEYACVLRAVYSIDGMTAEVSQLPMPFLLDTANQIIRNVKGINRVLFDLSTKPPATIEWE